MITPKERRHGKWFARSKNITRGGLALALGHHPVLYADATRAWIRPARDVAGRKNPRHVRFQKFINQHSVVGRDTRFLGQASIRSHAYSHDHQIAIQFGSVVEL